MEHISLAIVTSDKEYGQALSLALLNVCRRFVIQIYSANSFFEKRNDYDLILWDGEEAQYYYGERIIYLTEQPSMARKEFQVRRFSLYKYTSATGMVAAIFEIYGFLTGRREVNVKGHAVKLFCFSSWKGGAGCTTLARAVGQELIRFYGDKVLYVSLEEIESTGQFMAWEKGVNHIGRYLYQLIRTESQDSSMGEVSNMVDSHPFLESFILRDPYGMEAFAPIRGRNPLREIAVGELYMLLASLIESGRYDSIIIDAGNCISHTGIACMEMAEKICVVSDKSENTVREEQYFSHLICNCGDSIIKKVCKVVNKWEKTGEEVYEDEIVDRKMYIKRSVEMEKRCGTSQLNLGGDFGRDIKNLTKYMTEPL